MSLPAQAYDGNWMEDGDSRFDPAFAYQDGNLYFRYLNSHFLQAGPHGSGKTISFRRPSRVRKAVSGNTTTQIEARTDAQIAANPGLKFAFIGGGVNDIRTGQDPVYVSAAKASSIVGKYATAGYLGGIWAGPECNGENGAGTAACQAFDSAVAPVVIAHSGWVYLSMVNLVALALWPTFNPNNLIIGPLTTPDTTPGVHPNSWGSAQDAKIFRMQVTWS